MRNRNATTLNRAQLAVAVIGAVVVELALIVVTYSFVRVGNAVGAPLTFEVGFIGGPSSQSGAWTAIVVNVAATTCVLLALGAWAGVRGGLLAVCGALVTAVGFAMAHPKATVSPVLLWLICMAIGAAAAMVRRSAHLA